MDAVIVHSELQVPLIQACTRAITKSIPLFVPELPPAAQRWNSNVSTKKSVMVFGFFSPEKGQDVAIEAMAHLPGSVQLVLAGGVRRAADQPYHKKCVDLARQLGVQDRVKITGFMDSRAVEEYYQQASLVLAPFRETSGSASLVQAFAHHAPILTSDLPLNQDILRRVPGSMALFRSEDPVDCAAKIQELLSFPAQIEDLKLHSAEYAKKYSLTEIAKSHIQLYQEVGFTAPV